MTLYIIAINFSAALLRRVRDTKVWSSFDHLWFTHFAHLHSTVHEVVERHDEPNTCSSIPRGEYSENWAAGRGCRKCEIVRSFAIGWATVIDMSVTETPFPLHISQIVSDRTIKGKAWLKVWLDRKKTKNRYTWSSSLWTSWEKLVAVLVDSWKMLKQCSVRCLWMWSTIWNRSVKSHVAT
jgi:hypothetical protein